MRLISYLSLPSRRLCAVRDSTKRRFIQMNARAPKLFILALFVMTACLLTGSAQDRAKKPPESSYMPVIPAEPLSAVMARGAV
jgi:hypothetical protein